MTAKVMFSFSDQLVARMRAIIPARERSKVIAALLEKEIIAREKNLFLCAKSLEESTALNAEIETWDTEFNRDGLDDK
ncbi:MAG TPA: hypothetical protein VJK30_06025 [Coxiellaceae bacterium]|nr:MAG: hypothetical protein A3E81_06175 [Gammaproteobacteria bacterium RIFCSPHIGHO2_12_FULL_36_30]HLB56864.1 hypothetical protein [Coxiellaceae bacterium]